jgi:hypothetical protein
MEQNGTPIDSGGDIHTGLDCTIDWSWYKEKSILESHDVLEIVIESFIFQNFE